MSDEASSLSFEFASVATRAAGKLAAELAVAFNDLKVSAPEYAKKALAIEKKAAQYLYDGMRGRIDADIAEEAALREHQALEYLALEAKEKGVQTTIRRLRKLLDIGVEAGLALVKVVMATAV